MFGTNPDHEIRKLLTPASTTVFSSVAIHGYQGTFGDAEFSTPPNGPSEASDVEAATLASLLSLYPSVTVVAFVVEE